MSEMEREFDLPDDLAACQALVIEQQAKIDEQRAINEQLAASVHEFQDEAETLKQEYQQLELYIVNALLKRSKRYVEDPKQLKLELGDTPETQDATDGLIDALNESGQTEEGDAASDSQTTSRKSRRRRPKLPPNLPRQEVVADVSDEESQCDQHGAKTIIGYDTTETLVFERPKLFVLVTKYPKFACQEDELCGISSPERPVGIVAGNRYAPSVAAEVITAKYAYHLPLYRQQDWFAGSGWTPSRSTLLNILAGASFVLQPLIELLRKRVLDSPIVGTDDTRVTLMLPSGIPPPIEGDLRSQRAHEVFTEAAQEGRRSVSGRMWAYRSVTEPLTWFDFTVSRHRDGPDEILRDFCGTLVADCYSGYQGIDLRTCDRVVHAACNSHARSKVFDGRKIYPVESSWLLAKFQQLYDIEDRGKTMSVDERHSLRQSEAVPIWESMGEWLQGDAAKRVTPKNVFGKALGYLNNHWDALQRYLTDGRIPVDNNEVEQLMKQVAVGRKNWLFSGSVDAGLRAAGFFSLTSSAHRNDLDVRAYLTDVLTRLLAGETDNDQLLPHVWKASHPEAVREYRKEERRDRADRKQRSRARRRERARR